MESFNEALASCGPSGVCSCTILGVRASRFSKTTPWGLDRGLSRDKHELEALLCTLPLSARELVENGECEITHIQSKQQHADFLTKCLGKDAFPSLIDL